MAAATMPFTRRGLGKGPVLVFLHGWPDTDDVFEAQYSAFKETHVMYGLLLPGYGGDRGQRPPRFTGFTLEEVCEMFIRAVQSIKKDHGGETVDLIAHDWGCVISWMALAKEPNLVRRFVALDIGAHTAPNLKEKLMIVAYQWTLVVFFFLPSALGSPLTRAAWSSPPPRRGRRSRRRPPGTTPGLCHQRASRRRSRPKPRTARWCSPGEPASPRWNRWPMQYRAGKA